MHANIPFPYVLRGSTGPFCSDSTPPYESCGVPVLLPRGNPFMDVVRASKRAWAISSDGVACRLRDSTAALSCPKITSMLSFLMIAQSPGWSSVVDRATTPSEFTTQKPSAQTPRPKTLPTRSSRQFVPDPRGIRLDEGLAVSPATKHLPPA